MHKPFAAHRTVAGVVGIAVALGLALGTVAPAAAATLGDCLPNGSVEFDCAGLDLHGKTITLNPDDDYDFDGADLHGATIAGDASILSSFDDADLRDADLTGLTGHGSAIPIYPSGVTPGPSTSWRGADFTGADLGGGHFDYNYFDDADFSAATLLDADLTNADLDGATLTGSDLLPSAIYGLSDDYYNAQIDYALPSNPTAGAGDAPDCRKSNGDSASPGDWFEEGRQTIICTLDFYSSSLGRHSHATGTFPAIVYLEAASFPESYTFKRGEALSTKVPYRGDGSVVFGSVSGLPAGLSLSSKGTLSGTTTAATGSYPVAFTLTQTLAGLDPQTYTGSLTVEVVASISAIVATGVEASLADPATGPTAQLGDTIALDGDWQPAPVTLSYRWYRGTKQISGATKPTYAIAVADLGKQITAKVTGKRSGLTTTVTSNAILAAQSWTATPTPTIAGTKAVDAVLTAKPGTWKPTPDSLSYQWFRGTTAIAGATGQTYTVAAGDTTPLHALTVRVTGAKDGYTTVTKRSAKLIVTGPFTTAGITLSGTAAVGKQLTASAAGWSPKPPKLTYRWYRGTTAIKQATKSTYTVTTKDVGKALAVVATGSGSGYATVRSVKTTVVVPKHFSKVPTLTASSDPGRPVAASEYLRARLKGAWGPDKHPTLQYQWLRDGVAVTGLSGPTLDLDDVATGHSYSVRVTASAGGYADRVLVSKAVALRPEQTGAALTWTGPSTPGQYLAVGQKVTTTVVKPAHASVAYKWYRDGVVIKGATKSSYTVTNADRNHNIGVEAWFTRSGYQTKTIGFNGPVTPAFLTAPTVKAFTGSTTGSSTTFHAILTGSWGPSAPDAVHYQWVRKHGSTSTSVGADSPYYSTTADDIGSTITVRATASKANWTSRTITSTAVAVATALGRPLSGSVSGGREVGNVLTATPGTLPSGWTPHYQWYRGATFSSGTATSLGTAIPKATSAKHPVAPADAAQDLLVRISYAKSGMQTQVADIDAGLAGRYFTTVPTVKTYSVLQGTDATATLGAVLTGSWGPEPPDSVAFTWRRGSTIVGTGQENVPSTGAGKYTLTVVASKAGYPDRTLTSSITVKQPVPAGSTPTIVRIEPSGVAAGALVVGTKLQVTRTGAPAHSTVTYRWYDSDAEGDIKGATHASFTLRPSDAQGKIGVRISYHRSGKQTREVGQEWGYVQAYFTDVPKVTLMPTPGVVASGSLLTVTETGSWAPAPDSEDVRWYRRKGTKTTLVQTSPNSTAFGGETYALTGADAGSTIFAKATVNQSGFSDRTVTSESVAVGKVLGGMAPDAALTGTLDPGSMVSVTTSAWRPKGLTVTYRWQFYRSGNVYDVPGVRGWMSSLRFGDDSPGLPLSDANFFDPENGYGLRVLVTATKPGYQPAQLTLIVRAATS